MQLGVLGSSGGWHLRDLQRASSRLDMDVVALDYRDLRAVISQGDELLRCGEVDLRRLNAVLVRAMPPGSLEQVVFRMDVLHRLESHGIPVVNPPRAIECAVDKFLALTRVAAVGLPVPETVTCEQPSEAMECFRTFERRRPGRGVVVKPLFGSEGRGLRLLIDEDRARCAFEELAAEDAVFYLQEFIPHPGWDLRVLVIDNRVAACMRRRSAGGDEWRTNISLGGSGEPVVPDATITRLSIEAAAAVGTRIAGVDLIPDEIGQLSIVEVNAAPGWRELAAVSGTDIALQVLGDLRTMGDTLQRSKNDPRKTSSFVRPNI